MSHSEEENEDVEIHGFKFKKGEHSDRAIHYLSQKMGREQVRELMDTAEREDDRNAKFSFTSDGEKKHYKIEHHDGEYRIKKDHNHLDD